MGDRDAVAVVGCGDVTWTRVAPALARCRAEGMIRRVTYLDVLPASPFEVGAGSSYMRVSEPWRLPVEALERAGALGRRGLVLVCTPTKWHACHAVQLARSGCRIGVEKPLTQSVSAAERLVAHAGAVHALGHQLFKKEMREFLARRGRPLPVAIVFELWETKGVGARAIDDAVWDLGWHGFEVILAVLRADGEMPKLTVERVVAATYDPPAGDAQPSVFTAALIEGVVVAAGAVIPFRISVGKGLGEERKRLTLNGGNGAQERVCLRESGWQAHYRMITELLRAPEPNLGLALTDAVEVVRLCRDARGLAVDAGSYCFGTTPALLAGA